MPLTCFSIGFLCGKYLFKLLMEWKFLFGTKKQKSQIISCTLYFSFKAIKILSKPVSTRDDLNFSIFITYHIFFPGCFFILIRFSHQLVTFYSRKAVQILVVPISRFYWGLKNESNSHTKAIFKGLKENRQNQQWSCMSNIQQIKFKNFSSFFASN